MEIDLTHEVDVAILHRINVTRDEDHGVIHDDLAAAQFRDRAFDIGSDALRIAHVRGDDDGVATFVADGLGDRMNRSGQARVRYFLRSCHDDDRSARAREVVNDVLADSARCSGDDRHLDSEQLVGQVIPLQFHQLSLLEGDHAAAACASGLEATVGLGGFFWWVGGGDAE